jgi:ammonia channel protein AmtB
MERFEPKRKNEFVPHNSAFMTLGTFILWFSWYGFNSGSILRLNQGGSEIASKVYVSFCHATNRIC